MVSSLSCQSRRCSMPTSLLLVLASSMATAVTSSKNSFQSSSTISHSNAADPFGRHQLPKGQQHTVWRFLPGDEDDDEVDDKDKNDKPVRGTWYVAVICSCCLNLKRIWAYLNVSSVLFFCKKNLFSTYSTTTHQKKVSRYQTIQYEYTIFFFEYNQHN